MMIVLVLLHIFVCLFLVVVILLQAGRGQGLSWGVFGGSPQSILGTKTTSFLTRLTTACAIIFLFTCIGLNIVETHKSRSLFAPKKPLTQVDFQKIKDALEKAKDAEPAQDAEPKSATDHGEAPDEKAPALPPQADPS
ncbi:MAG: preprotein translocase subunit SecG [Omnitrophica bacterium RIFCSPLOWO2_12_FULL_50_11]|nr:MAG: preprotein translocase subunit SecG [Omnitrophica bacterium RIFCSPLOWO2_12_FULL_50_11]